MRNLGRSQRSVRVATSISFSFFFQRGAVQVRKEQDFLAFPFLAPGQNRQPVSYSPSLDRLIFYRSRFLLLLIWSVDWFGVTLLAVWCDANWLLLQDRLTFTIYSWGSRILSRPSAWKSQIMGPDSRKLIIMIDLGRPHHQLLRSSPRVGRSVHALVCIVCTYVPVQVRTYMQNLVLSFFLYIPTYYVGGSTPYCSYGPRPFCLFL